MNENRDVRRIKGILEKLPDIDVWLIGGKSDHAKLTKEALEVNGVHLRKTKLFSQSVKSIEGFDARNALIILCDQWWKNPVADTSTFRFYLQEAMFVKQVGEI